MNCIKISLDNIPVKLPEGVILVAEADYQELISQVGKGRYYAMKDVLELLTVSRPWLLDNVLLNPKWRDKLDIERSQTGFVKYPKNQGGRYLFLASKTRQFFEENFSEILKET